MRSSEPVHIHLSLSWPRGCQWSRIKSELVHFPPPAGDSLRIIPRLRTLGKKFFVQLAMFQILECSTGPRRKLIGSSIFFAPAFTAESADIVLFSRKTYSMLKNRPSARSDVGRRRLRHMYRYYVGLTCLRSHWAEHLRVTFPPLRSSLRLRSTSAAPLALTKRKKQATDSFPPVTFHIPDTKHISKKSF